MGKHTGASIGDGKICGVINFVSLFDTEPVLEALRSLGVSTRHINHLYTVRILADALGHKGYSQERHEDETTLLLPIDSAEAVDLDFAMALITKLGETTAVNSYSVTVISHQGSRVLESGLTLS